MIKTSLLKFRAKIRRVFPIQAPRNWDEEAYLSANPDVEAAVNSGILSSGFEHWRRRGLLEGRRPGGFENWQQFEGREKRAAHLPQWLRREMVGLSEIEPKLFPSREFCTALTEYYPLRPVSAGRVFAEILNKLGNKSFTHVFLIPWLKAGGADLEALHHIRVLSSHFAARVLVILTNDSDSPWLSRLPPSVATLHFGRLAASVDRVTARLILARLLLKLKPAIIHNVNSAVGWQTFCRHGAALSSQSKLYASVFCFDYTAEGEPVGYATDLEKAYPYLEGIFCDNQAFAAKLNTLYGISPSLFSVMRYPVRAMPRFTYVSDDRPHILWAGRMDRQKRPDILKEIAESLPECVFHVYGSRLLDASREAGRLHDELRELKNVILCGRYESFDLIPTANYVLFLYTTQWDGMPNVVLEALASGLAVLAPDIGGIAEVIPPDSGFLIPRFDDIKAYIDAIQRFICNPRLISEERDKRIRFLQDKYSHEQFVGSLAILSSYALVPTSYVRDRTERDVPGRLSTAVNVPQTGQQEGGHARGLTRSAGVSDQPMHSK